ncbi:mucin-desulfating sulfatase (n-acetylglucosamine-6-sulfatase) [Phlyctema vagabunda]|uniref:Mucin-desulfating sulfatase (N-acetylglucosamine-6-sulfatase) n=1 Tax=Phlyctema vagabunda TaxID=108571 RepID=A0ABR4PTL7_9HELO
MAGTRPNIIFIMADDHASKAISCYGAGINSTPNLDRIAEGGMRFDHCYVTNSICTPSRASILTGTYNHVNGVVTLDSVINKHIPNVAKHLRTGGYQTAMIGKWHLGEGEDHEPTGFDYWSVVPGQGEYFDPAMIEMNGTTNNVPGYATDVITDKSIEWMRNRQKDKPFFLMCHHKAPHRSWECDPKHKYLFENEDVKVPDTFDDDYKHRAKAAGLAKMKVSTDLTYHDLGLVQPDGGSEVGERLIPKSSRNTERKIPYLEDVSKMRLIDKDTAEVFTFQTQDELRRFKYQRYMKRYLRTIASIDDNVGRMLDYLESEKLTDDTLIIYTSDQGFFLGDHGWFDKRFMYEESFQMPFIVRYPKTIKPGSICKDIICNVDFAATFLELAGLQQPSYMQGRSFIQLLEGKSPPDWPQVAYHRYWMHRDMIHDARAHYGIRNQRYKIIFWYNKGYGLPGTKPGGEDQEWELFDCDNDPLELLNVYKDISYADVVKQMKVALNLKMAEIGDEPEH